VFPIRKDVITFHEGYKKWKSHSTHFLKCSQVQLYISKFKMCYAPVGAEFMLSFCQRMLENA
jgi:hypothetical protein